MKGRLISCKDVSTKFEREQFRNRTQIPKRKTPKESIIEAVARAWMVCDPNRQPCDPDALIEPMCEGGTGRKTRIYKTKLTGQPEWKWFVPRAQATLKFLDEQGYKIVRKETPNE